MKLSWMLVIIIFFEKKRNTISLKDKGTISKRSKLTEIRTKIKP